MLSFYKNRRIPFAISLFLLIGGLIFCLIFGVKLDIQFRGGSLISYDFTGEIEISRAEHLIEEAIGQRVTTQQTTALSGDATRLVVNVAGNEALSPDQMSALIGALDSAWPEADFSLSSSQLVAPFFGREMLKNSILAILVASALIVAYVWFSFRSISGPSAGVMALVALFHDIVIAFYVFVILQIPLSETFVAVTLTILGFSINDTIVIYDRIRENVRLTGGSMPLSDLVDQSISQSLTRSLNTSICTFGAVAVAYVFAVIYGLGGIREFTLPLMFGIISGAYSSIFLAGPLWVMWKTRGGRTGYEA